ncbi:MAG: tetratricopeptide repeat protein, partial [Dolichospermum sp.]
MKNNNQENNWLLGLLKHPSLVFGFGILLCCGGCVDSTRVLTKDDLGKIAQSSTATRDNAERLFDEGMKLYQQGTADSLRQAIKKWEEALPLYRVVNDQKQEATTLNNIGLVYNALGEKQKALDYYNQALPILRAVGDRGVEATTLNNIGILYRDTKRPSEAIKNLEESVDLLLKLRSGVGRENRQTFLDSQSYTAISLVNLLIDQNQPEKAFAWVNLATVADLADYSRLVNAQVANPEAQAAIKQWNQKNQELENLRKQL